LLYCEQGKFGPFSFGKTIIEQEPEEPLLAAVSSLRKTSQLETLKHFL
jgi:hypothetical protein